MGVITCSIPIFKSLVLIVLSENRFGCTSTPGKGNALAAKDPIFSSEPIASSGGISKIGTFSFFASFVILYLESSEIIFRHKIIIRGIPVINN